MANRAEQKMNAAVKLTQEQRDAARKVAEAGRYEDSLGERGRRMQRYAAAQQLISRLFNREYDAVNAHYDATGGAGGIEWLRSRSQEVAERSRALVGALNRWYIAGPH